MKATLRNTRISPKKANLVAKMIRGERVEDAELKLKFTPKKAANTMLGLLESAVANAENNFKQKKEDLVIKEVQISKGFTLRRFRPVSRGRAHPIKKMTSHIHIYLENQPTAAEKPKKSAEKNEKKENKKTKAKKSPAKKKTKAKKSTKSKK